MTDCAERKPLLMIAGGGTGGHVFPGLAVAEEWRRRGGEAVFVGTEGGQENRLVPPRGFAIESLPVGRLKGAGLTGKLATLLGLPKAACGAWRLLRRRRPDVVLGIGGYASGPVCLIAALSGRPCAVTEQNARPGFTNRVLGRFVRRVFIAFPTNGHGFRPEKTVLTGNPAREGVSWAPYEPPAGGVRILVFGGSQGAIPLNAVFTAAIALLRDRWPGFEITHQAGQDDSAELEKFYRERRIRAVVSPFFENMGELYRAAQIVVCRAGAGTVAELALSGRPAILVPYPFAADDHQSLNAKIVEQAGGGWAVAQKDLTPSRLAGMLKHLGDHPEELAERAGNIRALARPEAAKAIAEGLWEMGGRV